jgi:hypothetical protein
MLKQAYGEDCLNCTQCSEWYQCFILGRMSTEDPKTGLPSTSVDDDHVEKVCAVICENHHRTVCEVSEEVGNNSGETRPECYTTKMCFRYIY